MKNISKLLALLSVSILVFISSCNTADDLLEEREAALPMAEAPSAGDLDLSVYVSVGNSLTAGFMDYALYDRGQGYSLPNIIAGQFAHAGGGEFNQPDINSANGFNSAFSDPANGVILGRTYLDLTAGAPLPVGAGELIGAYEGDKSMLNNWGIPGARVVDVLSPAYVANPYYERIATDPDVSTVISDAASRGATFASVWLGGNDVLGWALSGGTAPDGNVTAGAEAISTATLTGEAVFEASYSAVLATMFGNGSTDGVVLTIPPILTIPFFQAVGHDVVPLDAATAAAANAGFAGHNGAVQAAADASVIDADEASIRFVSYAAGTNNAALIVDPSLTDLGPFWDQLALLGALSAEQRAGLEPYRQARQATVNDLMLLTSASVLGQQADPSNPLSILGVILPLPDQFTLVPVEQQTILARTQAFNTTIATLAAGYSGQVVVYDINPILLDAVGLTDGVFGLEYDGYSYTPDFAPNGIYSTDGIHPNPRGNAIIANEIIDLLNTSFSANIPKTDVGFYPSVEFR